MVCRNEERAQRAIRSLREEVPSGCFDYIHFDLTRLRTCKDAAETFLKRETRLDILINNAAVVSMNYVVLPSEGKQALIVDFFRDAAHLTASVRTV